MLTMYDEFAGVGGTSHGASMVPGLEVTAAANHNRDAIESHSANFPDAEHFHEDITTLPVERMPYAHIFGASPACPPWTDARGVRRDFDRVNAQQTLFGDAQPGTDERTMRGRLLVTEVHRYLRGMIELHGKPVLGGVVENVIQFRHWTEWQAWLGEFHKLGYLTRVVALNSMHAQPVRAKWAPQSRDRLYVVYWHKSLRRAPDFDKWLRPEAYCPTCDRRVYAMQVFKRFGVDMGRYGAQYTYRCPSVTCRHREVFPEVLPALAAIDPTVPGIRIGDRAALGMTDLASATMDRIRAGIRRYWEPLMVPVEGRPGKVAAPASVPLRTQTTRSETGYAYLPPFITPMRGGGDKERARSIMDPVHTVTAGGNHHGLVLPPPNLLVPYYGAAESAIPDTGPIGTLTTRDRYALAAMSSAVPAGATIDVDDVLFRMLEPHEIGRAMAFDPTYRVVAKAKRTQVKLYGNAVTPPVAEILYSALVECITGETLTRERVALAA